jgi:hypothetical protein
MISIFINELWLDVKELFKGWRLLITLIMIGIAVLMIGFAEEEVLDVSMMMFIVWSSVNMRPRISRLYYLLPYTKKSRLHQIYIKSLGVFLFNMVVCLSFVCISAILKDHSLNNGLRQLLCEAVPLMITYISVSMSTGYEAITARNNKWMKKHRVPYILCLCTLIFPISYINIISDWSNEIWYVVFAILSYLSAILILGFQIAVCRHMNFRYEKIRKEEKIFT